MLADPSTRATRHHGQDTFESAAGMAEPALPRWDQEAQAVRFELPGTRGGECAIVREALELLCGQKPVDSMGYVNVYRQHRVWIDELARVELEFCSDRPLVLGSAVVRFQLACEATELPTVICV
jgi:hypothetical protein